MSRALRDVLNESNANKVPSAGQELRMGDALSLLPCSIMGETVASHRIVLPTTAKAIAILFAFSNAGTLTGQLAPISTGAAPTTGQVGVSPTGDVIFATADAVTNADVVYLSAEGEVVTETLAVASHVATPTAGRRALVLLSATATAGGSTGAKTVDYRAAALAAGEAGIRLTGTIGFAAADAVTEATVTYVAKPSVGTARRSTTAALQASVNL